MTGKRLLTRIVLPASALVVAIGLLAPMVNAGPYRERIRAALERSLHRPVKVGEAHYSLFRGPGFEIKDVLIGDTPAAGPEAFAYVGSLEAVVRLTSLWTGHLSFSTLRLNDATVNLVKTSAGPWNVEEYLTGAPASANVPAIEIRSTRLNFKFGDKMSNFYVSDADVDIYPAPNGAIGVRFSGSPARTDRPAEGFASVSARGLFLPGPDGRNRLSMGLQLEQSHISDLMTLLLGHDPGVHGLVDASLHFDGSLSGLEIAGNLNLADVHRWDLMPAQGETWPLRLQGIVNLAGQTLDLETQPAEGKTEPITLHLAVDGFLRTPRWSVDATMKDAPANPMAAAARHFGAPIPDGSPITGVWNGTIGYDNAKGWSGSAVLTAASVAGMAISRGELTLNGGDASFGPADVTLPSGHTVAASLNYSINAPRLSIHVSTSHLAVAEARQLSAALGASAVPLLDSCRTGAWSGEASYTVAPGEDGAWAGRYELQDAEIDLPDLAAPLRLAAVVSFGDTRLQVSRIRGHVGKIHFEADFRSAADTSRLRLLLPELDLADLAHLMRPLIGGQVGLLARLRLRRREEPAWLAGRDLAGTVEVASLLASGVPLGSAQAQLNWKGPSLTLDNITWQRDDAEGSGKLAVNFAAIPRYRLTGRVQGLDWRDGTLRFEGSLTAAGAGTSLVESTVAQGTFAAENIQLATTAAFDQMTGTFHLAFPGGQTTLRLDNLQAAQGAEVFTGHADTQDDGRILFELASARRQIHPLAAGLHFTAATEAQ
jgi:hypothetical protein